MPGAADQIEGCAMAFEDVQAELGLLLTQIENETQPDDRHEIYLVIRRKLNELRAYGMPLPQDLVELERSLEQEFEADQRGDTHRANDSET